MNLRLFFSLPYKKDKESYEIYPAIGIKFDKRFFYENAFIKAKVRVVNYYSDISNIFLKYQYKDSEVISETYIAEHEFFGDKILIKNICDLINH